jgi:hypothetical protein
MIMLWYGTHRIATAYMYPKPTEPFIFQRNSFPNSLSRYSILSSFSLMVPTPLSLVLHSSRTHEFSGGGAAVGAAAPPPEKKNFFFKKNKPFSNTLFYLDLVFRKNA